MENSKFSSIRQHKIFRKGYFSGRGKIIILDTENAEILNEFFFNAGKNLKTPRFRTANPFVDYTSHSTLNAILIFQTIQVFLSVEMLLVEKPLAFHDHQLVRLLKKNQNLRYEEVYPQH